MKNNITSFISQGRKLFEVAFIYRDGCNEYTEHYFYSATEEQLEREIRTSLGYFADEIPTSGFTWTFEDQEATKDAVGADEYARHLEVRAREIKGLEDLDIRKL